MKIKVMRHGNSLGFNIPAVQAQEAQLAPGQEFELSLHDNGTFELKPVSKTPRRQSRFTAEELLTGIPEEGLHYEDIPEVHPVGKEADWC